MGKRINPNLAKIHRNYTVEEIANLFSVHKNTVRLWVKNGLPTNDDKRPMLILGSDLKLFLQSKRRKHKHKCKPYEIYCVRCRSPQIPAEKMADYEVINDKSGRLFGICPHCESIINKYFNFAGLSQIHSQLDITVTKNIQHINDRVNLLLNSDFKK